jgi:hypothetical protein
VKQDAVDLRFVLEGDGRDVGRHGKDQMEILAVQDLGGPMLDPALNPLPRIRTSNHRSAAYVRCTIIFHRPGGADARSCHGS